jgi:hypothetical protein
MTRSHVDNGCQAQLSVEFSDPCSKIPLGLAYHQKNVFAVKVTFIYTPGYLINNPCRLPSFRYLALPGPRLPFVIEKIMVFLIGMERILCTVRRCENDSL